MSISKRIAFGAAASWFSRCITIILGLVLMPILFRYLPKEELGIWLLLGQSWAALGILDLGFGPTLTRRIAFAKGKSGGDPNVPLTEDSLRDIANLVATGRVIYRVLAVGAFLIAFGSGFFYLRSLELNTLSLTTVWIAWAVICLSQGINVWGTIWDCLLQGVGYVGWDAILGSCISTLTLISQIIAILCGGGLISLAVIAAIGAIFQRFVLRRFSKSKRPELFQIHGKFDGNTVRGIVPLALKAWITALGASMILYTDQFIIASFKGAAELPAYRAAWVLIHNFSIVAVTFGVASGVFISHLWQSGDLPQIHRLLERNARLGWLIMLTVSAVLFCAGESLFSLWLGPGNFVGYPVLAAFLFTATLETQGFIISTASRATGDEAFAVSSLAAGLLKLILSIVLARYLGLLGIALGTLIALVVTNHWYIPWRGLVQLNYSRWRYVRSTILPSLLFFVIISTVLALLRMAIPESSAWVHFYTSVTFAGIALSIALFFFVIEPAQRLRLLNIPRLLLFK